MATIITTHMTKSSAAYGAPLERHRHHLPAAHIHHFCLDAGAAQQIGPRCHDHGDERARHDGSTGAKKL
jgi:hypothetical protein